MPSGRVGYRHPPRDRGSKPLEPPDPNLTPPWVLRGGGPTHILAVRAESRDLMKRDGLPTPFLAALTTAPSAETAKRLVRTLVERRLVACGTVLPGASSTYWWHGVVTDEEEVVVVLKTTTARWAALAAALPALHPYEVPELVALPIVGGYRPYLDWLRAETGAAGAGKVKPRRQARSGKRKR